MSDKWLITSSGQLLFFCLLCVSILLVSCERRDLTYYEVSEITLTADWNDSGLDDKEQKYGATAVFYPRNGGEPKIFMMGDRSGDAVRLPMGVYDIIVFNRSFNDFSNIAFRGNSYETLEAYARKVETRVDTKTRVETRTIISSPMNWRQPRWKVSLLRKICWEIIARPPTGGRLLHARRKRRRTDFTTFISFRKS